MLIDEIRKYIQSKQLVKAFLTPDIVVNRNFDAWLSKIEEEARIRNEKLTEENVKELESMWNANIDQWVKMAQGTQKKQSNQSQYADAISNKVVSSIFKEDAHTQIEQALKFWAKSLEISDELVNLYKKYFNKIILKNKIDTEDEDETTRQVIKYIDSYILMGLENKDSLVQSLSMKLGQVQYEKNMLLYKYIESKEKAIEIISVLFELAKRNPAISGIMPDLTAMIVELQQLYDNTDKMIEQMEKGGN